MYLKKKVPCPFQYFLKVITVYVLKDFRFLLHREINNENKKIILIMAPILLWNISLLLYA